MTHDFSIDGYDFDLPESLIAQSPLAQRDRSRLMVLDRRTGQTVHHVFSDLPDFLTPGDLMVRNNTRVMPARLVGRKHTGGRVEVLIIDHGRGLETAAETGAYTAPCLVKSAKPCREGQVLEFDQGLTATVEKSEGMARILRFSAGTDMPERLAEIGHVPLPPYIRREEPPPAQGEDARAYQTVYASADGAVAAPTAGLHFTDETLSVIRKKGVDIVDVTLHVGYGTFSPVRAKDIRRHVIHEEWFSVSPDTARAVNQAKDRGRRIVAVGTTSVRTLEFAGRQDGRVRAGAGCCDLFIYPGYVFRVVDAMITNFHLPRSSLIMLVSAFAGRESILAAYQEAVAREYRFFSYGDAMFIC